jgi:hypothetical protein
MQQAMSFSCGMDDTPGARRATSWIPAAAHQDFPEPRFAGGSLGRWQPGRACGAARILMN